MHEMYCPNLGHFIFHGKACGFLEFVLCNFALVFANISPLEKPLNSNMLITLCFTEYQQIRVNMGKTIVDGIFCFLIMMMMMPG